MRHWAEKARVAVVDIGGKHRARCFLARTAHELSTGLQFHPGLAEDEGMLFEFRPARTASMWMPNTVRFPIDIVFVGPDRRVSSIVDSAQPGSRDTWRDLAAHVIELPDGTCRRAGIVTGDTILIAGPRSALTLQAGTPVLVDIERGPFDLLSLNIERENATTNEGRTPQVADTDFLRLLVPQVKDLISRYKGLVYRPSDDRRARIYMKMCARYGVPVQAFGKGYVLGDPEAVLQRVARKAAREAVYILDDDSAVQEAVDAIRVGDFSLAARHAQSAAEAADQRESDFEGASVPYWEFADKVRHLASTVSGDVRTAQLQEDLPPEWDPGLNEPERFEVRQLPGDTPEMWSPHVGPQGDHSAPGFHQTNLPLDPYPYPVRAGKELPMRSTFTAAKRDPFGPKEIQKWFSSDDTVAIFTAARGHSRMNDKERMNELMGHLQDAGVRPSDIKTLRGQWEGRGEPSVAVRGLSFDDARDLSKMFEQDAFIFKNEDGTVAMYQKDGTAVVTGEEGTPLFGPDTVIVQPRLPKEKRRGPPRLPPEELFTGTRSNTFEFKFDWSKSIPFDSSRPLTKDEVYAFFEEPETPEAPPAESPPVEEPRSFPEAVRVAVSTLARAKGHLGGGGRGRTAMAQAGTDRPDNRLLSPRERRAQNLRQDLKSLIPRPKSDDYLRGVHPGHRAVQEVSKVLSQFVLPSQPRLRFTGYAREEGQGLHGTTEGFCWVDAEVDTLMGHTARFRVPVNIRRGLMIEPSIMVADGAPYVLTQASVEQLVNRGQLSQPQRDRANMYVAPPGRGPQDRPIVPLSRRRAGGNNLFDAFDLFDMSDEDIGPPADTLKMGDKFQVNGRGPVYEVVRSEGAGGYAKRIDRKNKWVGYLHTSDSIEVFDIVQGTGDRLKDIAQGTWNKVGSRQAQLAEHIDVAEHEVDDLSGFTMKTKKKITVMPRSGAASWTIEKGTEVRVLRDHDGTNCCYVCFVPDYGAEVILRREMLS